MKWTPDKHDQIVREYRAGKTYIEIAAALGVTPGALAQQINMLRAAGVDLPARKRVVDVSRLNEIK